MKKQRRWMKSVVDASKTEMPTLPFQRQQRRVRAGLAMATPLLRTA